MDASLGNKSYISTSGYGYSKKRSQSVATWFINQYFPRHKLFLDIHHRGMKREDTFGYLDCVGSQSRPRMFLIELQSNMDVVQYTKTLLHELVHLKQWVEGSLRLKSGRFNWKGVDISGMDYLSQPHEEEAFRMEETLYNRYVFDIFAVWLDNKGIR